MSCRSTCTTVLVAMSCLLPVYFLFATPSGLALSKAVKLGATAGEQVTEGPNVALSGRPIGSNRIQELNVRTTNIPDIFKPAPTARSAPSPLPGPSAVHHKAAEGTAAEGSPGGDSVLLDTPEYNVSTITTVGSDQHDAEATGLGGDQGGGGGGGIMDFGRTEDTTTFQQQHQTDLGNNSEVLKGGDETDGTFGVAPIYQHSPLVCNRTLLRATFASLGDIHVDEHLTALKKFKCGLFVLQFMLFAAAKGRFVTRGTSRKSRRGRP